MTSVVVQGDKIVIAGSFDEFNGTTVGNIIRLQSNGQIDPDFTPGTGADDRIFQMEANGTGVNLYGAFRSVNGSSRAGLAGLAANGGLTSDFAGLTNDNTKKAFVYALAVQGDGKLLAGGNFTGAGG